MRKLLYVISGLLLIAIVCIYLLIPGLIVVSEVEQVESSERIISQHINDSTKRAKWWQTSVDVSANEFRYHFTEAGYNSTTVLISAKDFEYSSKITWTSYANNIVEVRWETSRQASLHPFKRVQQYLEARKIKSDMGSIIELLFKFITKSRNVYNLNIEHQIVKDTIFATAAFKSDKYPETGRIYQLIDSVKRYTKQQDAAPLNPPMLNISRNSEGSYTTTVALPVNKPVKSNQLVRMNRMVRGNILVAQVKGGPGTIKNAFNQMRAYMDDFKLSSPAIPFESMVTDRMAEPDTSGWITNIYYPIY